MRLFVEQSIQQVVAHFGWVFDSIDLLQLCQNRQVGVAKASQLLESLCTSLFAQLLQVRVPLFTGGLIRHFRNLQTRLARVTEGIDLLHCFAR